MIINQELTDTEKQLVIATVIIADNTIYFIQGDEDKYTTYLSETERLQNEYINNLNQVIANLR